MHLYNKNAWLLEAVIIQGWSLIEGKKLREIFLFSFFFSINASYLRDIESFYSKNWKHYPYNMLKISRLLKKLRTRKRRTNITNVKDNILKKYFFCPLKWIWLPLLFLAEILKIRTKIIYLIKI